MSDIDELLAAFEAGAMLRPSAGIPNIVDLSIALASIAGAEGVTPTANSPALAKRIGDAEHLVFILADGLGFDLIKQTKDGGFLKEHLASKLQTVFPSATAVALTTLATGEWPNKHGVTGWWTHLPQINGAATILQFTKRSDKRPLTEHGVASADVFPVTPIMSSPKRDTLVLFPTGISESMYSTYFSGGRTRLGYRSLRDGIDFMAARIKAARKPTYTYFYTDRIDKEAHVCGVTRPEIRGALNELDNELGRLYDMLDGRARIVVSADHGFLDADEGFRHLIRASDSLMSDLRYPPSGDARVLYLHTHKRAEANVRDNFQRRFGDRFLLVTVEEAEDIELFGPGPISADVRERMGNMIAISRGSDAIEYRGSNGPGRVMHEASQHSGLSPEEMLIPLLIA